MDKISAQQPRVSNRKTTAAVNEAYRKFRVIHASVTGHDITGSENYLYQYCDAGENRIEDFRRKRKRGCLFFNN